MSFCNNDSFGQEMNEDSNIEIANDLKEDQVPPLSNSENNDNNQGTNLSFENIGNLNSNTEEAQQNEIL